MDWMDYVRMTLPWPWCLSSWRAVIVSSPKRLFVLIPFSFLDERFVRGGSEDVRGDGTDFCFLA